MDKWTKGPWKWLPNEGQFIVDANHQIVAEIPCQGANPADGPLIAAAPELLEALRELLDHADEAGEQMPCCLEIQSRARSALAKATS